MSAQPAASDGGVDAAPRGVSRWRLLFALLGAGVLVAAGWAYWWWTPPEAFGPYGNGIGGRIEAGQAMHYDTGLHPVRRDGEDPEPIPVTLNEVTPVVSENSADADIEVRLCRVADGGTGIGAVRSVRRFCDALDVIDGDTQLRPPDQVIVTVVPQRPGVVHIEGAPVDYRDGIRRGSQHSGLEIHVRARQ